jgi:hypothetical protein
VGIVSRSQSGGGIGALLFDSTLGANAAAIDTGAGGIAQTQNVLEAWLIVRTADAGVSAGVNLTFNNDAGANYDVQFLTGANATASAAAAVAQANVALTVHGSGGGASYASVAHITIPGYTQTTFFKTGEITFGRPDSTAANERADLVGFTYRSAAAITRMAATGGTANLLAGSRLLILGR